MRALSAVESTTALSDAGLFFGLTYLWSWVFWGIAVFSGFAWPELPAMALFAIGGIGPALVGSFLVYRRGSRARLKAFWRRTIDPRTMSAPWLLAIALVAVAPPLLARLVLHGSVGAVGSGDGVAPLATLVVAILAGLVEEPGWRSYALDRLQTRFSALNASLLLGVVWALWHLPLFFIAATYQNELDIGAWQGWLFFIAFLYCFTMKMAGCCRGDPCDRPDGANTRFAPTSSPGSTITLAAPSSPRYCSTRRRTPQAS